MHCLRIYSYINKAAPAIVLFLCSLIIQTLFVNSAYAQEPQKIAIYLSGNSQTYQTAYSAIKDELDKSDALFELKKVVVKSNHSLKPLHGQTPIRITIGTKAARFVLGAQPDIPTISILIPKIPYNALISEYGLEDKLQKGEISAIYIDQPPARQLDFIKQLLPDIKSLSIALDKSNQDVLKEYKHPELSHGLDINSRIPSNTDEISSVFEEMLTDTDALLVYPSPKTITPNSAKWLLYMAYKNKTPVIAYSKSFVKAGAVGAIYSTPALQGKEVAELIIALAQTDTRTLPPPDYPSTFAVSINHSVAKSLGISTTDEKELKDKLSSGQQK